MTYFPITFASLGDTAAVPTTGTEVGPINFQYGYGSNYSASLQTDPNALQVDRLTFNYMINQLTGNWQALPLRVYRKKTMGPAEAEGFIRQDLREWWTK